MDAKTRAEKIAYELAAFCSLELLNAIDGRKKDGSKKYQK